jgi:hypothetical protein
MLNSKYLLNIFNKKYKIFNKNLPFVSGFNKNFNKNFNKTK